MSRPHPVRIRTFTVPLAGVALYYFAQFAAVYVCLGLFGLYDGRAVYDTRYGTYMVILSAIMCVFLSVWLSSFAGAGWRTVRKDRLSGEQALSAVPIALGMLGLINLYMIGVQLLAESSPFLNSLLSEYQKNVSVPATITGFEAILAGIGTGILIPVVEEFVFRGIILGEFLSTMKPDIAVLLSALIFGMMHMQPVQVGYALICGMILGYVYLFTNSIFTSIAVHSLFNLLGGVLPPLLSNNQYGALAQIELYCILIGIFCVLYLNRGYRKKKIQEG